MKWAALIAAVVAMGISPVRAADLVSIAIVDVPRPQEKWGYAPATRRVQPGTWITWNNNGEDAHTVTATDGTFDSGNLDPSEGFSWFFDQPGTFQYICALHPWMAGKIVVGSGVPPPSPPPLGDPTSEPPPPDPGSGG